MPVGAGWSPPRIPSPFVVGHNGGVAEEEDLPPNVVPLRSDQDELVVLEERVMDALDEQDRAWADRQAQDDDQPAGRRPPPHLS